jgi:hypothetical protein
MFVILCLFFGPVKYYNIDYLLVTSYIFMYVLLFFVGYCFGVKGISINYDIGFTKVRLSRLINILFKLIISYGILSSIFRLLKVYSEVGSFGVSNIGKKYIETYSDYVRGESVVDIFYVLNIFDQAIIAILLLFGISNFSKIYRTEKFLLLLIAFSYLFVNTIAYGKQKFLGDIVVFIFYYFVLSVAKKKVRINFKHISILIFFISISLILFLEIFSQRYEAVGIGLHNINSKSHPLVYWDLDSFLLNLFGGGYGFSLAILLFYFSNGLCGLSLSLKLPFEWSFFAGSSYSVGRIVEILFSAKGLILEKTYPYRAGEVYGWGLDKWHSAFAWLASDFTFWGVLFITPFFAFFYARIWIQSVNSRNAFSSPLFVYLSLALIFSYSNNQIVHSPSGVIVLSSLLCGWLLSLDCKNNSK